jgi:8-oxo-dGTP diphosphatase
MANRFHGAKAAVFIGARLLIYQRDRGVRWPRYWDFPGGGREGDETPRECLRREVFEEFGVDVPDAAITWGRAVPSMVAPTEIAWFFAVQLPPTVEDEVLFGDEGQQWALIGIADVMNMPNLVAGMRARLRLWLKDTGAELI